MVQLRGSNSFMMGSTPKQIEEAIEQCKQQAVARSKTTHGAPTASCQEDAFTREGPRHAVSIRNYSVDKHPVQVDSFVAFLNQQGSDLSVRNDRDSHQPRFVSVQNMPLFDLYEPASGVLYDAKTRQFSVKQGYATHAIEFVSWFGASLYCRYMGKRLLTEAEYEYAADHNQEAIAKPLGLKLPGPMAEWVYDDFVGAYPSCLDAPCSGGETTNTTGDRSDYRTVRGCGPKELPAYCRITARTRNTAAQGHFDTTFRCAMTLTK
jgi:formylglycine-generating enzyme required for sulfatase activity